jgi:DNA-binding Lrp family transcriptional regulator
LGFDRLDEVDVKLIAELETNPRRAYTEIASNLGLSRDTVRTRLQRLLDTRAVRIVGVADPISVGYTTSVVMGINVRPDRLLAVADTLAAQASVQHVMLCMGRFDIIAFGLFRKRTDFLDFLVGSVGNLPGVLLIESMLTLRHTKIFGPLLSDGPDACPKQTPVAALDPLDFALMKELQTDARQNSRRLAKKLGTSQSTVLRKIQGLQSDGVMRIVTLANPLALGYEGVASIGMKFDPAKVNEGAQVIGAYRNVQTVAVCAGRYDIIAWAMFRELSDLSSFITLELGSIPGLQHSETMTSLKIIKASHRYLGDDTLPSTNPVVETVRSRGKSSKS